MKQCIDIYTAVHSDNINKQKPGSAFGAVCVGKVNTQTRAAYDEDKTYLPMWMASMSVIIGSIANGSLGYESVTLLIHTWTPNINKMCKKLQSIFEQLKDLDEEAWDVVEIKLRRSNRTKYEYHDDMAAILLHLLHLNKHVPTQVQFCITSPKKATQMSVAHQKAELALING